MAPAPPRKIAVFAYPGVMSLDVAGPLQVFASANAALADAGQPPAYALEVLAAQAGPLVTSCGLRLFADRPFREAGDDLDTLLIAGGRGSDRAAADREVVAWVRGLSGRVRRLGSVCSGAFVLAAAGLLDGRRAVTHWNHCARLADRYPQVRVEPDALHLCDGGIYTSAGVTAGMDLALALVEEDLGHKLALTVARQLVLFLKRPGGQSQFSAHLMAQASSSSPIGRVQEWILANLGADLSIAALAERAAMSPRNFARAFRRETGDTPAQFVERARLEEARRRLEESRDPVERIAAACGFGTAETMRRVFIRHLKVPPQDYRSWFQGNRPPSAPSSAALH